jgi:hypothetical protein
MPLDSFFIFANNFNITSGRSATSSAVSNLELAAIFFDSIAVAAVDRVGGLNFEEFWEALVRCSLTYYLQMTNGQTESIEKALATRQLTRTNSTENGSALAEQQQMLKKPSMRNMRAQRDSSRNSRSESLKSRSSTASSSRSLGSSNSPSSSRHLGKGMDAATKGGSKRNLSSAQRTSSRNASNPSRGAEARKISGGQTSSRKRSDQNGVEPETVPGPAQATLYDPFAESKKALTCVDTIVKLFELLTESIETSITRSLKKKKTGKGDANLLRLGGNEFVRRLNQQKEARQKQVLGRSRGMTAVTVDMSVVQVLTDKELWYVFLFYAVRSGDPWSMDKGRLLAFFKDSRLLQAKTKWQPSMKKPKANGKGKTESFVKRPLTKQEVGGLYNTHAAANKGRQFQFSCFKNVLREAAKLVSEVSRLLPSIANQPNRNTN